MIDELKSVLSSYPITITENPNNFTVKANHFLPQETFAKVAKIVRGYGGDYISAGKDSRFTIPKNQTKKKSGYSHPEPTRKPEANKFTNNLPKDAMITVAYSRKVSPRQYESVGFTASVEVPVAMKEDARFTVVDFVESSLAKRLQELEQEAKKHG